MNFLVRNFKKLQKWAESSRKNSDESEVAIETKEEERFSLRFKFSQYMNQLAFGCCKLNYSKQLNQGMLRFKYLNVSHIFVSIPLDSSTTLNLYVNSSCNMGIDNSCSIGIETIEIIKAGEDLKVFSNFSGLDPELIESYEQKLDEMLRCILPDLEEDVKVLEEKKAKELKKKQDDLQEVEAKFKDIKCK